MIWQLKQYLYTQAKQNQEFIHHFPLVAGVQPSSGQQSSTTYNQLGNTNVIILNILSLTLLLLPLSLYTEHDAIWSGVPLGSAGIRCSSCVHSQPLCSPAHLTGEAGQGAKKALTVCQLCSAITETSLSYHHCFDHKSKQPQTSYSEEKKPVPTQTRTFCFCLKGN